MKVKCIYDNSKFQNELTLGKVYVLIKYVLTIYEYEDKEKYEYYMITDDNKNINRYPKNWFIPYDKTVSEIRNEKIDKLLEG